WTECVDHCQARWEASQEPLPIPAGGPPQKDCPRPCRCHRDHLAACLRGHDAPRKQNEEYCCHVRLPPSLCRFDLFLALNGFKDCPGELLRQLRKPRQPLRELPGQLLVTLKQGATRALLQEPGAIPSLARECGAHPVVEWCRHDPDHLRGLCLLPQHQQHFRSLPLARRAELLDLVGRHWVEKEMLLERRGVAGL